MDCQTFDDALLDALYGELDDDASKALHEHAAGCSSCAEKLEGLSRTRERIRPALEEPIPGGFEARVLAAAEAAMPAVAAPAVEAPDREAPRGAKVIPLFARPQLAIAATFLLVAGASVVFLGTSNKSAPSAKMDEAAPAASAFVPMTPDGVTSPVVAATTPPPLASAIALAEPAGGQAAPPEGARYAPAPRPAARPPPPADERKQAGPDAAKGKAPDPTLARADAAYASGKYREALALYQDAAQQHRGTAAGSQAALGVARCHARLGEVAAARSKLEALKADDHVATEAKKDLDRLDASGVHAAPPPAKPQATERAKPANGAHIDNAL